MARKASVPLYIDGAPVAGSGTIARYVDRRGSGKTLFPSGQDEHVQAWESVADVILASARGLTLHRLARDAAAQRESLPRFVPGLLAPVAAMAARFLDRKYDVGDRSEASMQEAIRPSLDEVRRALGSKPYLTGVFSYADVCIATALQCLRPANDAPFGPATRAIWANEVLAADYEDLVAWRDGLYEEARAVVIDR